MRPPQVWDLKDLGLQAAQRVLGAADPLHLLTEISQNFPGLAESLSKSAVEPELRAEAAVNARIIQVPLSTFSTSLEQRSSLDSLDTSVQNMNTAIYEPWAFLICHQN